MSVPSELKYTKEHEWIRMESGNTAVVGITEFAQGELGDIVYVEVDTVGQVVEQDAIFGTVEAVKTTSDLFMPIKAKVLEFNPQLNEKEGDNPGLINSDPYGAGWIVKVEVLGSTDDLLSAEAYQALIS